MSKYDLYWTSCAAHCIDLIFEDIRKKETVAEKEVDNTSHDSKTDSSTEDGRNSDGGNDGSGGNDDGGGNGGNNQDDYDSSHTLLSPFSCEANFTHATRDIDHGSRTGGSGIGALGKEYIRRHALTQEESPRTHIEELYANLDSMSMGGTDHSDMFQDSYASYTYGSSQIDWTTQNVCKIPIPFSLKNTQSHHSMDLRESILNQTDISVSLAKRVISAHGKDSNLVLSPLSIHVVLSLIATGSGGPTRNQLLCFLKSKSSEELDSLSSQIVTVVFADGGPLGGPLLSFANGVWVDRSVSLKPAFKQIVENTYRAASTHVDFQNQAVEVTKEVNVWADKETNGLIKEILPSNCVDTSTRLILANAVYFKGAWNEKFDASETKEHDFFLLNGSSVQAPFMTSKKKQFVCAFDGFKVLGLSYKRGDDKRNFSMYIFLPEAKDGLPALIEKVSSGSSFIERHLPHEQVKVGDFRIPKFKIGFGFEASQVLKGLGLVLPFSGGGLTEMVDSTAGQELYVSNIFHKSFIEVNEEGTEAAAATAGVVRLRALLIEDKLDFVADHPFLFVLREDTTGVVLFIGQLLNPLAD
ncbi:Serine protease inhibitor family protein [Perilla frutescens var. frutescens]|nr:Serine protease inhibitor family protein [Perilla frutescens var. frutescens]